MDLAKYLATAVQTGVKEDVLRALLDETSKTPGKYVIAGFNAYGKHLANILHEEGRLLAFADDDPKKQGWRFRSVPVLSYDEAARLAPDFYVCAAINGRFEVAGLIEARHGEKPPRIIFPRAPMLYEPALHNSLYRDILAALKREGPPTMLSTDKIVVILEALSQVKNVAGDVLELGAWMGGSAYLIAQYLHRTGSEKNFLVVDEFDSSPVASGYNIHCLDETRAYLAFHPKTTVVRNNPLKDEGVIAGTRNSFIHLDVGYVEKMLEECWESLVPGGMMIMDNYNWGETSPSRHNRWFAAKGVRVFAGAMTQGVVWKAG